MVCLYIHTHIGNTYIYSHTYIAIYIGMWCVTNYKQTAFHDVAALSGSPIHVIKHPSILISLTEHLTSCPSSLKSGSHMRPSHPLLLFQMTVLILLRSTRLGPCQEVSFVSSLLPNCSPTVLEFQLAKPSHINSTSGTRPISYLCMLGKNGKPFSLP